MKVKLKKTQPKNKIICDGCKNEIEMSPVAIKLTNIKIGQDELLMQYFLCPNCEYLYKICLFTYDLFLRKDKKKLAELNQKYNGKFTYNKDTKQIYYHESNMDKRKEE